MVSAHHLLGEDRRDTKTVPKVKRKVDRQTEKIAEEVFERLAGMSPALSIKRVGPNQWEVDATLSASEGGLVRVPISLIRSRDAEIHDLRAVRNYCFDEAYLVAKGNHTAEHAIELIRAYIIKHGEKDYRPK